MVNTPKVIKSENVYSNKFLDVKVDTLELDGNQWEQAYFAKPNKNSVGILPIDDNGIYLLHIHAHPLDQFLWQIPLGQTEKEVSELDSAKKILFEKANLNSEELIKIGSYIPEPEISNQEVFIY